MTIEEKKGTEEALAKEVKMFGETVAAMESMKPEFVSNEMYAMMILSDAQEMMNFDMETARQFINKAKYYITKTIKANGK
jgi:hypothetical protein